MSAAVDPRLRRLLGGPELAAVRQRLRRRFEQLDRDAPLISLRLDRLDAQAHRALSDLTGRPSRVSQSMTLDIADLDTRLREAGLADSLRDALERLDGPIISRARMRRELASRWRSVVGEAGPMLRDWLDASPSAIGLLKRLARDPGRASELLAAADAVLTRLPASGMPRSQLAAGTLGDAHALDAGRPVTTLVLGAWRWHERIVGKDDDADEAGADGSSAVDGNAGAERARAVWARAGVSVSELARPVLYLNLPLPVDGRHAAIAGEPGYLSLRLLLRQPQAPAWSFTGCRVYVCENPDIVAIAADRFGAATAPLICTDGMPAAAQRILLDQLAAAGAQLLYHGDYDWPGIAIANFVIRTWQALPWRFSAADYRAAIGEAPSRPDDLGAGRVEALWDAELAAAMDAHGLAIAEEAVVDQLLGDLRRDGGG